MLRIKMLKNKGFYQGCSFYSKATSKHSNVKKRLYMFKKDYLPCAARFNTVLTYSSTVRCEHSPWHLLTAERVFTEQLKPVHMSSMLTVP